MCAGRPPPCVGWGLLQSPAAVPGLVEQLTGRELEVLALLAAGTPNPRIAAELVVTLETVKKHVSHLLGSSAPPTAPRPSPGPDSSA